MPNKFDIICSPLTLAEATHVFVCCVLSCVSCCELLSVCDTALKKQKAKRWCWHQRYPATAQSYAENSCQSKCKKLTNKCKKQTNNHECQMISNVCQSRGGKRIGVHPNPAISLKVVKNSVNTSKSGCALSPTCVVAFDFFLPCWGLRCIDHVVAIWRDNCGNG